MPKGMDDTKKERRLYEPVKALLSETLKTKYEEFHLEITADKTFSNKLKSQVGSNRDIIFLFLKDAAPDITGFVKEQYSVGFVVVEIKSEKLKLDDIYQTRKYAELFDAKYALLVTTEEIPEELKRLSRVVFPLLRIGEYKTFNLLQFDEEKKTFREYFPENPFSKTS
jgi:hypothetical protein